MSWRHRHRVKGACNASATGPRVAALDGGVDGRWDAYRLLLPFRFGDPRGDIGLLRIEILGLVKGGDRFDKPPRHQTRVPARESLVR